MRILCHDCFAIPFEIDWGTSDDADTFISAHVFFKNHPNLCDADTDNVTAPVEDFTDDMTQEEPITEFYLTQPDAESVEDTTSVNSDDDCLQGEAVLNCFFHVVQAFAQKKGYAKKIKDKSFAAAKTDGRVDKNTAYSHVCNIAKSKTVEQRQKLTELYLNDWRLRGEDAAADHFEKEYCHHPRWNWNYYCSGEVGVYPSNCPNESFNRHGIKGICADCPKNASLCSFLVHTATKLLKEDAFSRGDPCTIEIPRSCSVIAVGLCGFLQESVDLVELGTDEQGRPASWLANFRFKIGCPLDSRRLDLVRASLDGDIRPFIKKISDGYFDPPPAQLADDMILATSTVCHLQRKGGNIVGDCEDCVKHLGYSCPGAIYLRSKHNLLDASLETLRKTSANARGAVSKASARGSTRKMYQSGLSSHKRRCVPKMLETLEAYLESLSRPQMIRLIGYLHLFPYKTTLADWVKEKEVKDLLDVLVSFHDNPTRYRQMQASNLLSTSKSSFEVVKKLASNIKEAPVASNENKRNT
ncbi:hypothetical protein SEMRO_141_G065910.1 [Seminavis robusta]|uniref:Uncharacterized protein n=1 Tax=Seminavis robusta TaxID=568900 RepID=A0A9N8DH76_9STRA|nr:hypothetical protein SEMRO_141_G065910.1 [Seminavis robusta]|eukprot:Sro141_g065910.1 n/a (527) ;mRNA; f:82036-83616